jgi:hypothetical protein
MQPTLRRAFWDREYGFWSTCFVSKGLTIDGVERGRMAKRLSRTELYDLVWSEPLKTLCSRFGISDVALKKTCARSEIPTPERGYWARKDAGKPTFQVALPIRPPRMDDQVLIAAGQSYWYQDWKRRSFLALFLRLPNSLSQSKQYESGLGAGLCLLQLFGAQGLHRIDFGGAPCG